MDLPGEDWVLFMEKRPDAELNPPANALLSFAEGVRKFQSQPRPGKIFSP